MPLAADSLRNDSAGCLGSSPGGPICIHRVLLDESREIAGIKESESVEEELSGGFTHCA
ncbi:hypothetical protein [Rhizobium sp. AN70]|uniref:hypothetical protein n=1 Tax=Rhizobium sp. AN70 TaxID=3035123 RepID=UPI00247AB88D|nr:hypothetical protein [Rhizobium sp. AN70]MDH7800321.1 hypothetical protein [Rhizobium sp. AN70]